MKQTPLDRTTAPPDEAVGDLSERERIALSELRDYLTGRVERERRTKSAYEQQSQKLTSEIRSARRELKTRIEKQFSATQSEYERLQEEIKNRFEERRAALVEEEAQRRLEANSRYQKLTDSETQQHKHLQWETQAAYIAKKAGDKEEYRHQEQSLEQKRRHVGELAGRGKEFLDTRRMLSLKTNAAINPEEFFADNPEERFDESIAEAEKTLAEMERLFLPKLVGPQISLIFVAAFILMAIVSVPIFNVGLGLIIAGVGAIVLGGVAAAGLFVVARGQVRRQYQSFTQFLARAQHFHQQCVAETTASFNAQREERRKLHRREVRGSQQEHEDLIAKLLEEKCRTLRECDEQYPRLLAEITQERDDALTAAQRKYPPILRELKSEFDAETARLDKRSADETARVEEEFKQQWSELTRWASEQNTRLRKEISSINDASESLFPAWSDSCWPGRTAPEQMPGTIRFGEFDVPVDRLVSQSVEDAELRTLMPPSFTWPAFLSFPHRVSTIIEGTGDALTSANQVLQNMMLRLLTTVPPGKVRFTIIDPVGLGQDFAAFMHLADHDEMLVGTRIWTETGHIEQRLVDLTEHMENVIQKYLRNQFETIEAYNAEAGEIAEPYRVLVIAKFPTNFSEASFRRLESILSAGARCGVFVLMSADHRLALPAGKSLSDLTNHAVHLKATPQGIQWTDPEFGRFGLRLDDPASTERITPILNVVGQRAKAASRVEVPFRVVAPVEAEWWKSDSRREIRVPLGRSGATKLQELVLGPGTSQHALVAGKTGSGKSTLLHTLVTSAALRYSPNDVEFYLIDFKKGVEFKTYAAHALPHARVIAIESEREFGLSVMQRLDAELKIRGDKFRELGVQDIGGYRDLADKDKQLGPMPRILFIVDEFQEFFVSDDKLSQEASLLLDRLVRQGRAFGIHVLLGSQTLGGAYSLARSTLGQMAVRIALQCSESDAHLILSEDNTAARLLSRPGEAIYNDANGRVEGNNPFQIVWLPDDEREWYLDRLREKTEGTSAPREQIVFEGNIPARLEQNRLLSGAIESTRLADSRRPLSAWLGEAIEIKEPTTVEFGRQNGTNLLLIGQVEDVAVAAMSSTLIGIAAQSAPSDGGSARVARFYILDGSLMDSAMNGQLVKVASALPHTSRVINRRDMTDVLAELVEQLTQRQNGDTTDDAELFLFVQDIGRLRDLRRDEDDFGFSSTGDAPPKPDKLLATLVKDGPPLGIHVVVWCDSLANLQRTFDRQAIREFGLRILFQMSPTDSSTLIDSPAASRLGQNRAFFHHEDVGRLEKFRPYGLPDEEWLDTVRIRLSSRSIEAKT